MNDFRRSGTALLKFGLPLIGSTFLTGCYTYSVMQRPSEPNRPYSAIPGIPFYVQRAACRQETVYQENVLHVRLLVERLTFGVAGAITKRDTTFNRDKLISQDSANQNALRNLRNAASRGEANSLPVITAFDSLAAYDPASDWSRGGRAALISNQMTPSTYVDYSTTFYMNSQRPIVGSATNTFKINPNGTLAEGSATIEDKTVETVGGLVPFADIFTPAAAATAAAPAGAAAAPHAPTGRRRVPAPRFHYTLTVEAAPVLHTLARTEPLDGRTCPQLLPITKADSAPYEYRRKLASAPEAPEPPKGNNITISGQLTLPPKQ